MGLFQHKNSTGKKAAGVDQANDALQRYFDEYFAELRGRGLAYFDKAIDENVAAFKKDLDGVVERSRTELKEYTAKQLDALFVVNGKAMQEAENVALQKLTETVDGLMANYKDLAGSLETAIAQQQQTLQSARQDAQAQIAQIQQAQAATLDALTHSAEALKNEQQTLIARLEQAAAAEEQRLIAGFETNMAAVIEHYLIEALGDQFDVKAQLPGILKQLEVNKQAMQDDMKL